MRSGSQKGKLSHTPTVVSYGPQQQQFSVMDLNPFYCGMEK